MDRPGDHCRDPGRGNLGIYCFRHQQPGAAVARQDHGRRCPESALPWQGRLQRSGSVYLGGGALFCGDCRGGPEFLGTTKPRGDAEQDSESAPDPDAAARSAAVTSGACANSCRGFSSVIGHRAAANSGATIARDSAAGRILVAAGSVIAAAGSITSASGG